MGYWTRLETRCSAVALRDPVKADFERDGKGVVAEDWLHVVSDEAATELRFPEKPCDLPSLHIWRVNGKEYTATYHVSDGEEMVVATPYGRGWKRLKGSPPSVMQLHTARPFTVWWRAAPTVLLTPKDEAWWVKNFGTPSAKSNPSGLRMCGLPMRRRRQP